MDTITNQRKWPGSGLLWAVGQTLDTGLPIVTYQGGFVWPATKYLPRVLAGMLKGVIVDGAAQNEGPGAPGAPGAPSEAGEAAAWPADSGTDTPLVRRVSRFGVDFAEVLLRYPQFNIEGSRGDLGGITLSGTIQPIADLEISASLVVQLTDEDAGIRAWAWWEDGIWVGPRHTYVDGSICAFEPSHGTWHPESGAAALLDLHAVWLARQLYLRAYGRWPGPQRIHTPVERLAEQLPDEQCGCGRPTPYIHCCFRRDQAQVSQREIKHRVDELARRAPSRKLG